ncbi:MAG: PmoA family protein [Pirellulales bacterium]|nr:PmoA family protein [Pirellulales bacterium]
MSASLFRHCMAGVVVIMVAAYASFRAAHADDSPILAVAAETMPLDVAVDLPGEVAGATSEVWELVEQDVQNSVVPVDIAPAVKADGTVDEKHVRLLATIWPREGAAGTRRFALRQKPGAFQSLPPGFTWRKVSPESIELREADRPVFTYNFGDVTNEKVPKKDFRRTRGCYVHPIHGLDGEVLTDDFPRDHYHHHGLFWAWPHVGIDGKQYDLWEGPGIRLRFVRWLDRHAGPQSGTIGVENGWFVGKKKIMIERIWLTAHKAGDTAQSIDVEATWIPTDRPITLQGRERKSYGGVTIRFAVPRRQKGVITVANGVTKRDLSVKRLAWADLTHAFGDRSTPSGATLMISKSHPDYPPTWLTRHYGPLCVGYPGVEPRTLEPGEAMHLSYRLWIHKDAPGADTLKAAYDAYTAGQAAKWEKPPASE